MTVLKNLNNISDELKESIPQLENGEVRRFKMLTGVVNNDPLYEERIKRPMFYGSFQIPCNDKIKDPFIKNKSGQKTGGYVDIGVVTEFDTATERATRFRFFLPGKEISVPGMWNGEFYLTGGIIEDEELFEYLWICNYNNSNPYRDKKKEPLFESLDIVKEKKNKKETAMAV